MKYPRDWYIKIQGPRPLGLHTFLHRTNNSGVKIRPAFKKNLYSFLKVENVIGVIMEV